MNTKLIRVIFLFFSLFFYFSFIILFCVLTYQLFTCKPYTQNSFKSFLDFFVQLWKKKGAILEAFEYGDHYNTVTNTGTNITLCTYWKCFSYDQAHTFKWTSNVYFLPWLVKCYCI